MAWKSKCSTIERQFFSFNFNIVYIDAGGEFEMINQMLFSFTFFLNKIAF